MNKHANLLLVLSIVILGWSCDGPSITSKVVEMKAKEILGNPDYPAISYGGYRVNTRDTQPTIDHLKEDMKILSAMGIRIIRTYNVHFLQASNVLEAIRQLKTEDENFEMYVMLGIWINCENAFTANPNHDSEDSEKNAKEVDIAVELAIKYDDIVKVLAVGNEAMVKWATSYFVQPGVILKWVNHLQRLKLGQKLPQDLWITSSDNFASWGGGGPEYQVEDLEELINAVDFISMHTYPMHDTHYNPQFWGISEDSVSLSKHDLIQLVMVKARNYAVSQYNSVVDYVKKIDPSKPIHIGETGWASSSNGFYGDDGSKATDEYKAALYYELIREWSNAAKVSCFYFEAFDENWKDAENPGGSENHFGLFTIDGKAKYVLWDLVDDDTFNGLNRSENKITKTYNGNKEKLLESVKTPAMKSKAIAQ